MATETLDYKPPPTIRAFMRHYIPGQLFYNWIVGPVGSGKTTGIFMKLCYMAKLQKPSQDGIRRTRAVVVRNTMPQLKDTTLVSWNFWFKDGMAGTWKATTNTFLLKFDDVECEVLFRALDTPDDIRRVLSLELTFAILDEFVQIPREIIDALSARLSRYPSAKDGGATNWGMWGSSNPDTEDNWWYDYLHDPMVCDFVNLYETNEQKLMATAKNALLGIEPPADRNATYFIQPSGLSLEAENLLNLAPYDGSAAYYMSQAIGKSKAWINQFVHAIWGFSASGKPVVATYNSELHIAKQKLLFQPAYSLVGGFDPGLAGTALIFGQEDLYGRLLVLGELFATNMGAERFIKERVKPYLNRRFPNAHIVIAPDPAAANRAQTDEAAVVQVVKQYFEVKIETNNRIAKRLDAIEDYTTRLTEMGPALLIDQSECPMLTRALSGGWRFQTTPKKGQTGTEAEKNDYSHVGDAFGYLCRYYHRSFERGMVRGMTTRERMLRKPVPQTAPSYHHR